MARWLPDKKIRVTINTLVARPNDPACPSRYAIVMFYPTLEEMRDAATEYNRKRDQETIERNILACVQCSPFAEKYDRRKKEWVDTSRQCLGVVRFAKQWLTPEIIAHESLHLALHLERQYQWWLAHKPEDTEQRQLARVREEHGIGIDLGNEEDVAYHAGQITQYLTKVMRELVEDGWAPEPHFFSSTAELESANNLL